MKIQATDSFFKSLKKIRRDNMWFMKVINFFRYELKNYFINLKTFHKALWSYRAWNGDACLYFLETALRQTKNVLEKYGNEEEVSRLKKIKKIERAITILNNINEDRYLDIAEAKYGEIKSSFSFSEPDESGARRLISGKTKEEKEHTKLVYGYSVQLEKEEWGELWEILKGQDCSKVDYDDRDGSGLRGWWD